MTMGTVHGLVDERQAGSRPARATDWTTAAVAFPEGAVHLAVGTASGELGLERRTACSPLALAGGEHHEVGLLRRGKIQLQRLRWADQARSSPTCCTRRERRGPFTHALLWLYVLPPEGLT